MISTDPIPILLLVATAVAVAVAGGVAQTPSLDNGDYNSPSNNNVQISFKPSIAVVIGIFSIMFSLTFLLLMYAKFCHSTAADLFSANRSAVIPGVGSRREDAGRSSGIDKAVIESLPFFSFSALRGSREGLECAVCLSRFDDAEVLRLLPRCKHAFHLDCIDRWLDSHSSCPLCRTRVDIDDVAFFKYSTSSHYLFRDPSGPPATDAVDDSGDHSLELYVEREHAAAPGSMSRRFASIRWAERIKSTAAAASGKPAPLHNIKHRIIVSDVVFRSRWSDFNSADLISLDSEMLRVMSSKRFDLADGSSSGGGGLLEPPELPKEEGVSKIKEEMDNKRRLESKAVQMNVPGQGNIPVAEEYSIEYSASDMRALISPASRCMSDITEVSRYRPSGSRGSGKEEKVRQMWLPIARRTVQWFAGKERRAMLLQPQSREDAEENV